MPSNLEKGDQSNGTDPYSEVRKGLLQAFGEGAREFNKRKARERGAENQNGQPPTERTNRRTRELQGKGLKLNEPELWPHEVDGPQLLEELKATFERFLSLPDGASVALSLWVLHAYSFDAWLVSPFLALTSPEKRCGKTTALELLRELSPRALSTSNITAAALFRTVEKFRPTLFIDEADTFIGGKEDLRGILNCGHSRGSAMVVRTVGEDFEPRLFSTWCPKAIALIGPLPSTVEDRSIVIPMRRRTPTEKIDPWRRNRTGQLDELKSKAARWALDHLDALRKIDPAVPPDLDDRAADNWSPLLAIADEIGSGWADRAGRTALTLSGVSREQDSLGVELLTDLRLYFLDNEGDRFPSAELVNHLIGLEDRPWAEYRNGKALTPPQLARLLKPFGVKPDSVRFSDGVRKGYERNDFKDAFARYLSPPFTAAGVERPEPPNSLNDLAGSSFRNEP